MMKVCGLVALLAVVLATSPGAPVRAADSSASPVDYDGAAAAAYCLQKGGALEHRIPLFNTNGGVPLRLAGSRDFCQFTASDGSRIHLLLSTLYSTVPTLAALAYIAKPKLHHHQGGGNPASFYCTQLGGSDQFGGTNAAGGGWYLKGAIDETLEACIFPDLSSIDSWGLAYNSAGIIRGINLLNVLRYHK